jgi:hypothetical protein
VFLSRRFRFVNVLGEVVDDQFQSSRHLPKVACSPVASHSAAINGSLSPTTVNFRVGPLRRETARIAPAAVHQASSAAPR